MDGILINSCFLNIVPCPPSGQLFASQRHTFSWVEYYLQSKFAQDDTEENTWGVLLRGDPPFCGVFQKVQLREQGRSVGRPREQMKDFKFFIIILILDV